MRKEIMVVLLTILFVSIAVVSMADPTGPTSVSVGTPSRYTGAGGYAVAAFAGNVTQLDINGSSITQGWQGYYGNVMGTIILSDNQNRSLYDWSLLTPSGQVYASRNSTIQWSSVNCSSNLNMTNEETLLNFPTTAKDGINETFTSSSYPAFYVGSVTIPSNTCKNTNLHNGSGENQATKWYEIILADSSNNQIYTSLLENNVDGYNNNTYDFQMIVAEDGHSGDTNPTNYYFWVELQ